MKLEELRVYQMAMEMGEMVWNNTNDEFQNFTNSIDTIGIKLNNYINSIGKNANK